MKYFDYHVHSSNSFDSRLKMEDACRLAVNRGLSGLTFTEHIEFVCPGFGDIEPYRDYYIREIKECRARFSELTLGMGAEVGLQSCVVAENRQAVAKGYDFVIGSVHTVDGLSVHDGSYSAGKGRFECYSGYLAAILQQVRLFSDFDVLGHIDLIRRDNCFADRTMQYEEFKEQYDALLRELIETGHGIEVNTAALRYDLDSMHPDLSVLKRYRALGGEIITCGSDAHLERSLGMNIREGYELIKAAGFKYITTFCERQASFEKLE